MKKLKVAKKEKGPTQILYCRGLKKQVLTKARDVARSLGYTNFGEFLSNLLEQYLKDNKCD